jgi:hypothetical protein
MARITIPSSHKGFLKNEKEQETLNKMDDAKCYAVQYRPAGEIEFTEISKSPRDIYTLEEAERVFRSNSGAIGTEVRLVKISRYLTKEGKLIPVSVIKIRTVR